MSPTLSGASDVPQALFQPKLVPRLREARQTGWLPYLPSCICDSLAGSRSQHPGRSATHRAHGRRDDDDLHPRDEQFSKRGS